MPTRRALGALDPAALGALAIAALPLRRAAANPDARVIPPFLVGFWRRIYAANCSFWAGVMPPMPMFGRSWL
jgi:hypothetical protein